MSAAPDPDTADWARNPFIAASAHHRPIGSGAVFAGTGTPAATAWETVKGFNVNRGSPYGRMVYSVDASSPRVTIARNPTHEDPYLNVPASNIAYPAAGVQFAGHTDNNDSVVVFIHKSTGEHCEFRECGPGGTLRTASNPMLAGSFRRSWARQNGNPDVGVTSGLGHGLALNDRVGHSAAGVAAAFGVIQGWELTSAGPIGHVLQFLAPGRPDNAKTAGCDQIVSRLRVLPATNVDGYITSPGSGLGPIPYGAVISLPHGFDLGIFSGLNTLQMKIVMAVLNYGLVLVDTGAAVAVRVAHDITDAQVTQIRGALNAMRPHLRLITNCAWDPTDRRKPTGGGTPRAANTAFDA